MYIGAKPCPFPGDMRCNSSQACIRSDRWCNNYIDCDDGSDEDNCCKHYVYNHTINVLNQACVTQSNYLCLKCLCVCVFVDVYVCTTRLVLTNSYC